MSSLLFVRLFFFRPFLSLALLFVTVFTVAGIGVSVAGHSSQPLVDAFNSYLDIFPGQPISAVVERGFCCRLVENYYTTPTEEHFALIPPTGIFSIIEVVASSQSVQKVKFTLNENALRLGDLLLIFELPVFHSYPQITFTFWRDYVVTLPIGQSAYVNPAYQRVWSVAFTLAGR
ncbi:MAG: hypothetical protein R3E39_25265 [Anaerolineae bacterium]